MLHFKEIPKCLYNMWTCTHTRCLCAQIAVPFESVITFLNRFTVGVPLTLESMNSICLLRPVQGKMRAVCW